MDRSKCADNNLTTLSKRESFLDCYSQQHPFALDSSVRNGTNNYKSHYGTRQHSLQVYLRLLQSRQRKQIDFATPWGKVALAVPGSLAEIHCDKLAAHPVKNQENPPRPDASTACNFRKRDCAK